MIPHLTSQFLSRWAPKRYILLHRTTNRLDSFSSHFGPESEHFVNRNGSVREANVAPTGFGGVGEDGEGGAGGDGDEVMCFPAGGCACSQFVGGVKSTTLY
jgi:hypothetical protein